MIPSIDIKFINHLLKTFSHPEGSMFSAGGIMDINIPRKTFSRIEVICEYLGQLKPNNILEMGTHKAEFCYLAKLCLPTLKSITTICALEQSRTCVDLVNEYFSENFITFICEKSPQCWDRIVLDSNFDFGWVDGGHDSEPCYADLVNFAKLGIPSFLVDDTDLETVSGSIELFLGSDIRYEKGLQSSEASVVELRTGL